MNTRRLLAPFAFCLLSTPLSFAADTATPPPAAKPAAPAKPVLPAIPSKPIAEKKELLFSDDFEKPELAKSWQNVVPTFVQEDHALKGMQTRVDAPAVDGKKAVVGHQAVAGNEVPTKDSVIEFRFKFAGATSVSAELVDRAYTGCHYGHICMARVTAKQVILVDQKEGSMRNDIYAMTAPEQKAEKAKLLVGRSVSYPVDLDVTQWHTFSLETVGDEMRVTVDGKPAGYLKSPGIAHATKSKVEFGTQGKDSFFDDFKIYNAVPAKS